MTAAYQMIVVDFFLLFLQRSEWLSLVRWLLFLLLLFLWWLYKLNKSNTPLRSEQEDERKTCKEYCIFKIEEREDSCWEWDWGWRGSGYERRYRNNHRGTDKKKWCLINEISYLLALIYPGLYVVFVLINKSSLCLDLSVSFWVHDMILSIFLLCD